jgi:dipeptidyl aminopeptidase/acylaminoacyl peptidase
MTFRNSVRARLAAALMLAAIAMPSAAAAVRAAEGDAATAPVVLADVADLRAVAAREAARPRPPQLPRAALLARPEIVMAALSPDGRHVAWLQDQGHGRSVWMLSTGGGEPRRLLAQTDARILDWSADARWLLLPAERQLFVLPVDGQGGGGAIAALGGRTHRTFFAVDRSQPAAALLLEEPALLARGEKRWRLLRVDAGGHESLLHEAGVAIVDAVLDGAGRLAWLIRAEGEAHVVYRVGVGTAPLRATLRCERLARCRLLGLDTDGALLLATSVDAGFSRLAKLHADGRLQTLHVDPRAEADVDDIVLDPRDGAPLFAGYRSTVAATHALTAEAAAALAAIRTRLPEATLQLEVGRGAGARWLVHERSSTLRGERLHVFDPDSGALHEILVDRAFRFVGSAVARPDAATLAPKLAVSWRGSDGMRLHGFLMLPPGVDPATAPLVAIVHGGPFNLVRPDFSNDGQLLTNRGYVVFLPNFRGSTGFGADYLFAANGDFGNGRVQRDIVEGVQWLLDAGIGDRKRVGIVGASFGGYSALLGITFQPELFQVGVAAVPPADFGRVIREYAGAGAQMQAGIPMATSMRQLSLDPADPVLAQRLAAQSPIAHAATLRRPLLMLAGGEDERVPIRGVTHYAAQLKALGKDVSLFVDADAGHGIDDERTREAYYFLMETMLHRHLGGDLPPPASRALLAHVRRNLRLTGSAFAEPATLAPPAASVVSGAAARP